MATRTGPQPSPIRARYRSDTSSSRFSFSTDRLITCHRTVTGRTFSTSSIHRDVSQAHGHIGSNQKSAILGCRSEEPLTGTPRTVVDGDGVRWGRGSGAGVTDGFARDTD